MYNYQPLYPNINAQALLYFSQNQSYFYFASETGYFNGLETCYYDVNSNWNQIDLIQKNSNLQNSPQILKQKRQTCDSLENLESGRKCLRKPEKSQLAYKSIPLKVKQPRERLNYRISWKNQNRNIVPNLVNQMLSYLFKQSKSQRIVQRLFARFPHGEDITISKYFQYLKKLKETTTHYANESVFYQFLQIHETNYELFSLEEQQFYMKICRIVALSFLRNEVKLIALTSKRMSAPKRKNHLVARQALVNKYLQLCRNVGK